MWEICVFFLLLDQLIFFRKASVPESTLGEMCIVILQLSYQPLSVLFDMYVGWICLILGFLVLTQSS